MGDALFVAVLVFLAGLAGFIIGAENANDYWERAAIERGLAAYCPTDGELAWKGECK